MVTAGIIRCSDFRDREVQNGAKADSLAKAFAVLQSLWTLINIISRAAYNLPISPIELSAAVYVTCGLFTYAFWGHKSKDMSTPITINLRWASDELPEYLRVRRRNTHRHLSERMSSIPRCGWKWRWTSLPLCPPLYVVAYTSLPKSGG